MSKAKVKVLGIHELVLVNVNTETNAVVYDDTELDASEIKLDIPIKGAVFGTLLNYKGTLESLGEAVNKKPYNVPPIAPILYIKPANTFNCHGGAIPMPKGQKLLEIGASLGIVIGKHANNIREDEALNYIAGYTIVTDVCVPHESVYRPAVQHNARDGFCPIGPWIIDRDAITNPDKLTVRVFVNDELRQENNTSNLVRSVSRLLSDVTEFMTLSVGDVLMVGVPENAPHVKTGDAIRVEIEGVGSLENTVVDESAHVWGVMK